METPKSQTAMNLLGIEGLGCSMSTLHGLGLSNEVSFCLQYPRKHKMGATCILISGRYTISGISYCVISSFRMYNEALLDYSCSLCT